MLEIKYLRSNILLFHFLLESLFRKYGLVFFFKFILEDLYNAALGVLEYIRIKKRVPLCSTKILPFDFIVVGYCLKDLECTAERFCNSCPYVEGRKIFDICPRCQISWIKEVACKYKLSVIIATSAYKMIEEIFSPLKEHRLKSGLFFVCEYSMYPLALALSIVGASFMILPYRKDGACKNWYEFIKADKGLKDKVTQIDAPAQRAALSFLDQFFPE